MKNMKVFLKSLTAAAKGLACVAGPIMAYANYYDEGYFDAGSETAYGQVYVGTITAGATSSTTNYADFHITGTAWDVYQLDHSFTKNADQTTYCDVYVSTGFQTNYMKEAEAWITVYSEDGTGTGYFATINPWVS